MMHQAIMIHDGIWGQNKETAAPGSKKHNNNRIDCLIKTFQLENF